MVKHGATVGTWIAKLLRLQATTKELLPFDHHTEALPNVSRSIRRCDQEIFVAFLFHLRFLFAEFFQELLNPGRHIVIIGFIGPLGILAIPPVVHFLQELH